MEIYVPESSLIKSSYFLRSVVWNVFFCIYKPRAIIICTNLELAFRILLMTFMPSAYNSFNVQVFIEINVNRFNCLMDSQCIYHAKNQNDSACSNMRFFEKK